MTDLDTLIAQKRNEIESHDFFKLMASGKINPEYYAWYIWQQRHRYERLEEYAVELGVYDEFPELQRYELIRDDFEEIWKGQLGRKRPPNVVTLASTDFMKRLKEIFEDEEEDSMQILAYIYVVVIGDMKASELAGKVPGSARIHTFKGDIDALREKLKAKLASSATPMEDEIESMFANTKYLYDLVWNDTTYSKF